MEPPSKTIGSASSQIKSALEKKLVMSLVRSDFFAFCIGIFDSNSTGGYTYSSCSLQWSKLILQPFAKTTNL